MGQSVILIISKQETEQTVVDIKVPGSSRTDALYGETKQHGMILEQWEPMKISGKENPDDKNLQILCLSKQLQLQFIRTIASFNQSQFAILKLKISADPGNCSWSYFGSSAKFKYEQYYIQLKNPQFLIWNQTNFFINFLVEAKSSH